MDWIVNRQISFIHFHYTYIYLLFPQMWKNFFRQYSFEKARGKCS